MAMSFEPNKLQPSYVAELSDWQLLVAACHFGPTMGDCVELNHAYDFRDDKIFCVGAGHGERDVDLTGDIDIADPDSALKSYAGITWQSTAREFLAKQLAARAE
jgi:hypothetical protein